MEPVILRNAAGMEVHLLRPAWGAAIQRLLVPGRGGALADVVLGFDDAGPYADGTSPHFGAVVGRVANRIAGARFTLDGVEHALPANNGPNCLHGGPGGFSRVEWRLEQRGPLEAAATLRSPDGDQGFPGAVEASAVYRLDADENSLTLELEAAVAGAATPVNLAQHSYFNLGGHDSGDVLGHVLTVHGGTHYTPTDGVQIPTGEVAPVAGTPFDFTAPRAVGERIAAVPAAACNPPEAGGYDHNIIPFGLGPDAAAKVGAGGQAFAAPRLAATVVDPASGRGLRVLATAPGLQLYTGNFLDGALAGKGGARYGRHAALCLETQGWPDAVNQGPAFPATVVRPGETYRHVVRYEFFVVEP